MPREDKYGVARLMMRNIQYIASNNELTDMDVARFMRKSRQTYENRKKNPKLMTVQDLINLSEKLGVRPSQLLEPLSPADTTPVYEEDPTW